VAKEFGTAFVLSGPLWLPELDSAAEGGTEGDVAKQGAVKDVGQAEKGRDAAVLAGAEGSKGGKKSLRRPRKFVKYEVIGDSHVAVPTHLFKVWFRPTHALSAAFISLRLCVPCEIFRL